MQADCTGRKNAGRVGGGGKMTYPRGKGTGCGRWAAAGRRDG